MLLQARSKFVLFAVMVGGLVIGLWWNHLKVAKPMVAADHTQAVAPPITVTPAQQRAPVAVPRPAPLHQPVVHADAIALRQALEAFPDSFHKAVNEGDKTLAQDLMETKMTQAVSPFSAPLISALRPLMEQEQSDFLWQGRPLVFMYWGGCLQLGCDKKAFFARLRRSGALNSKTTELCLESWATLLPLALHPATSSQATVAAAKDPVRRCLEAAVAEDELTDDSVVTQVQYFLGFLNKVGGTAAAESGYQQLLLVAPDLPPLSQFLPIGADSSSRQ